MAGTQHLLAALRHLRAEQRGHGTEQQDGRKFALASEKRKSLPFAQSALAIYFRQLLAPLFRLVTAITQTLMNRQWNIEEELVRLRPTTLSRKNQPVLQIDFGFH